MSDTLSNSLFQENITKMDLPDLNYNVIVFLYLDYINIGAKHL